MLCYNGSQVRVQREQMQVVVQGLRPSFMLAACSGDTGCEEDYLIADSFNNMYVCYIYYRPVQ